MTSLSDKVLLDCLSLINSQTKDGASHKFQMNWRASDALNHRTQLMKDFLVNTAKKYSTEGGAMLETASGSGYDSALLTSLGYKMVSCDISEGMVNLSKETRKHFLEKGDERFSTWKILLADLVSLRGDMESSELDLPLTFDVIFCVGTSFPFLLHEEDQMAAFKNLSDLLRPGGALVIDHRNHTPMIERGVVNSRGRNPCVSDESNGVKDTKPYVVFGPGRQPLFVMYDFESAHGSENIQYISRIITQERMTNMAKSSFGEDCKIDILYDLNHETSANDACWVTYIIEKPSL